MDFTTFDHKEHMTALAWLGGKDWLLYKDIPEQRAISAKPKKLVIKPKNPVVEMDSIIVTEKEFNRYPSDMWKVLKEIIEVLNFDPVGTLWYHTLAKALAGGPKIFRPTGIQCEALQNAEARYGFKDYKQPFPVIILEIPEEYRQLIRQQYQIEESPKFVLVNQDDKNKFILVNAFYSKSNIVTHITPDRIEYPTIEDSLIRNRDRRQNDIGDVDIKILKLHNAEKEFDAAENVQRLGINFAMMMSLYTVKEVGPLDPLNYEVWKKDIKGIRNNGLPTNKAIEAKQKMITSMNLIEFNQSVEFYDEIEEQVEVAQGVDVETLHRSPRSHWRRGHFAMQACGIGRRDRKMIFRKPILIRAKYFLGDIKNASVTYTMHPGRLNLQNPPSKEITDNTPTPGFPLPENDLTVGKSIEIIQADDCLVQNGSQGIITKIISLGSNIVQINAKTVEGIKFSLISPPDTFKLL